jgi:hypothetical protein
MFLRGLRAPLYQSPPDPVGGGAPPAATFTQADIDRIAANVRRETEAKFGDYAAVKAEAEKVATLSKEMQDLRDQLELKDKDAVEKEKILAERAREQSQREITALKDQLTAAQQTATQSTTSLRDYKLSMTVGDALTKAGVLAGASKHAQRAMLSEAEIELGDDGSIKGVKYGGVPQKDIESAAAAFLSTNTHFKAAAPGGGGTLPPNGGPVSPDVLASMSSTDALAAAMAQKPPSAAGAAPNQWDAPR